MYQQYHLGITDAIDYSKLKNAKYLIPSMKFEYGIGHIYSGKVGVYNPKIVPTAPASYKEVFDPDHGSKLGIIDIQYQYTLVAAALAAGGSRSEEHTSELQSLMRISYAVFCLKKKNKQITNNIQLN